MPMPSHDPQDEELPHWSDVFTAEDAAEQEARFEEFIARRDAEEAAFAELQRDAADLLF
jgi:hypothetical protein